jgi:hypothetical protein
MGRHVERGEEVLGIGVQSVVGGDAGVVVECVWMGQVVRRGGQVVAVARVEEVPCFGRGPEVWIRVGVAWWGDKCGCLVGEEVTKGGGEFWDLGVADAERPVCVVFDYQGGGVFLGTWMC